MELTRHAIEHIEDRTKMLPKDVLALICAGAVVELGFTEDYEYLLFFSPPDRTCKVAITTLGRTSLVSIWEKDFRLPQGIKRVNHKLYRTARQLCRGYILSTSNRSDDEPYWSAKIEVLQNRKIEYVHDVGTLTRAQAASRKACIHALRKQLCELHSIILENIDYVEGALSYRIFLSSLVIKKVLCFELTGQKITSLHKK